MTERASTAVDELERVAASCGALSVLRHDEGWASRALAPIAQLLGAETAAFREFSGDSAVPLRVASLGIQRTVDDAYRSRYYRLDPARFLPAMRFETPFLAHEQRLRDWPGGRALSRGVLARRAEEFRRYRHEFLMPNGFHHHVGFHLHVEDGRTLSFDFHRTARCSAFGPLERARARIVALHLAASVRTALHERSRAHDAAFALSARERQVAEAVALGWSNKRIAAALTISHRTVENHLRSIFAKLDVRTRTALVAKLSGVRAERAATAPSGDE